MKKRWWHDAVVYEIYCKSFYDFNGDGIGDLKGVLAKLPILKELGINTIWFTPINTSPQVDNGYDVADYQDIESSYGTLEDFKEVLEAAHSMGIRIIMDMVFNHTSDEHKWFQESRKSKENPYRNYYIWQPPKADGGPPNNWGNYFREGNGSAWEFDETTGEYYLHQYSVKMPDLNWEYAPLRQEIYRIMRWWLDMGVDGFRLDVFSRLKKPQDFPDTKKQPDLLLDKNGFVVDTSMCTGVEGIHEILHDMYENVFQNYDMVTVGEGSGVTPENALGYVGVSRQELDTVYHFNLTSRKTTPFTLDKYRKVQKEWAEVFNHNAWGIQYLNNHDLPRAVSRHGNDTKYRKESAKLLAVLNHTTPGIPFIYQGEEIGMTNVAFDSIKDYDCCYTIGDYDSMTASGVSAEEALNVVGPRSRDNARTPYQWNEKESAGFTTGIPWIKVNPRYKEINLATDRRSPDSIFAFYQKLIAMRRDCPAIIDGNLTFLMEDSDSVLMYLRRCARQTLLVIANKSDNSVPVEIPQELRGNEWKRLLSNREEITPSLQGRSHWLPWEAEIYELWA